MCLFMLVKMVGRTVCLLVLVLSLIKLVKCVQLRAVPRALANLNGCSPSRGAKCPANWNSWASGTLINLDATRRVMMNTTMLLKTAVNSTKLLLHATSRSTNKSHIDPEAWRENVPGTGIYTKAQRNQAATFIAVIYPVLLTLCTVGNTLNLVMLGLRKKKTTTTCYMMAMAVADLLLMWFALPVTAYNISFALDLPYRTETSKNATLAVRPYSLWIQDWSVQLCDWVLLIFSAERLVSVLKPFGFRWLHQPRTAQMLIVALVPLSGAYSVFSFVNPYLRSKIKGGFKNDQNVPSWLVEWRVLQDSAEVAMVLFKFFGLLVMNLTLIFTIRRQLNSEVSKQRVAQMENADQRYRSSNIILISSVALYLFSWFPSVVYKCAELADTLHMYSFDPSAKQVVTYIAQGFAYTNYSINFFLYLAVSKGYRTEFVTFFQPIFYPVWCQNIWRGKTRPPLPVATELNKLDRSLSTQTETIELSIPVLDSTTMENDNSANRFRRQPA